MNTKQYAPNSIILGFLLVLIFSCSSKLEFEKDCDLCKQISQKEVEASLINYIYNEKSVNISKEAESQLLKKKETLHHGFKFIECGCQGDNIIYRLWCANDETFELEVELVDENNFTIVGIRDAKFMHP